MKIWRDINNNIKALVTDNVLNNDSVNVSTVCDDDDLIVLSISAKTSKVNFRVYSEQLETVIYNLCKLELHSEAEYNSLGLYTIDPDDENDYELMASTEIQYSEVVFIDCDNEKDNHRFTVSYLQLPETLLNFIVKTAEAKI